MKKARSKTGFFVLGISFSAFGAEAQDARQKGLRLPEGGFIGRKDSNAFQLSDEELTRRYAGHLRMVGRVPDALSGAMGNRMFLACFPTREELYAFYADAVR